MAPGEEEISGNAEELFHVGQEAEKRGDLARAIRAYRTLVKTSVDALAPGAGYRTAELMEQTHRCFERGGGLSLCSSTLPCQPAL